MARLVAPITLMGVFFHEVVALYKRDQRTLMNQSTGYGKSQGRCKSYMETHDCSWTKQFSCEGQLIGSSGIAAEDDSDSYECCCRQGKWKNDEAIKDYLEAICNTYMATDGCAWTRDWSCAEQSFGLKGTAGEDGTVGHECCCRQGLWKQEAIANYQQDVDEWKATKAAAKPARRVRVQNKFSKKVSPSVLSNLRGSADAMNEVHSGVWNKVPQQEWESLCASGKLLPQVYFLGAPKSATTTLAYELMHAGVECVHDPDSDKEFHFFDGMMDWSFKGEDSFQRQKSMWLKWMPPCPASLPNASRHLLADFTPDYLRMVPLPRSVKRFGSFPPWQKLPLGEMPQGSAHVVSLPPLMTRLYGVEASRRLQFVVLLRHPLSRMQSAWYHAKSVNFTSECVDCRAESFQASLVEHMGRFEETPDRTYTDWLWTGMYGVHLEAWMEYFYPWQFLVLPHAYINGHDKDQVCKRVAQHINFQMDCDSQGAPLAHEWSQPHPPLEEDLSKDVRTQFENMMSWHKGNLVDVLAGAHERGMVLANYAGGETDKDAIMSWLEQGW